MRKLVAMIVMAALPLTAFSQGKAKPKPATEAKPAAEKMASAKRSKRNEDARHCLEKSSNTEIIKCAEAYL